MSVHVPSPPKTEASWPFAAGAEEAPVATSEDRDPEGGEERAHAREGTRDV